MWLVFGVLIAGLLVLDLGVFHRRAHVVRPREALFFSLGWISLALIFNAFVWHEMGHVKGMEFLTGYLIEESLSVDNLFVFIVIFSYFGVAPIHHHRILFWGIVGAIIMRAIFIASGLALIARFHWIIYILGLFLLITGVRMLFYKEQEIHPERNFVVRLFKKIVPLKMDYTGTGFLIWEAGRLMATPLLIVLLAVETMDVMFAVDSIPAIFAITEDPFIVYTSNIFAILGLRSLYFLLAGTIDRFAYLKVGLAFVLTFVGIKMLISDLYRMPVAIALGAVGTILAISIIVSLVKGPRPLSGRDRSPR